MNKLFKSRKNYKQNKYWFFCIVAAFILLHIFIIKTGPTVLNTKSYPSIAGIGSGRSYYFDSVSGNDSNPGTEAQPKRSLNEFNVLDLDPGDAVYFKRGGAWNGVLKLRSEDNGTANDPILISAYGDGADPRIENTTTQSAGRYMGIDIFESTGNLIIEDIHFSNISYAGIQILSTQESITIRDCEFEDVGIGINIKSPNVTVDNNYFHDLKMVINTVGGKDDYGAFAVNVQGGTNGISNIVISNNRVERAIAQSNDYGYDGGAFELFETLDGVYIFNNFVKDSKGFTEAGGSNGDDTLQNVYLYNNISVDNTGISFVFLNAPSGDDPYDASYNNFVLSHNTLYHAADSEIHALDTTPPLWFAGKQPSEDVLKFQNNIVVLFEEQNIADYDDFYHRNNLFYRTDGNINTTFGDSAYSPHSSEILNEDPLFVDPTNDDFRLQEGSPARNKGADLGTFDTDHYGNDRNQGSAPDMGAIEYSEGDINPDLSFNTDVSIQSINSNYAIVQYKINLSLSNVASTNSTFNLSYPDSFSLQSSVPFDGINKSISHTVSWNNINVSNNQSVILNFRVEKADFDKLDNFTLTVSNPGGIDSKQNRISVVNPGQFNISVRNSICPSDLNKDSFINLIDFSIFANNFKNQEMDCSLDIENADCRLDSIDFLRFVDDYTYANRCENNL